MTRRILPLLLAACTDPAQGIAVGNPGSATARVVPGDGVATLDGTLDVERLVLHPCEVGPTVYVFGDTLDLGTPDPVRLEPGTWCRLTLASPHLSLEGSFDDGRAWTLTLELPPVRVDARDGFDVDLDEDGDAFVLQLGPAGWLRADRFPGAGDVAIDPEDPRHEALAREIARGSVLRIDTNRDGEVQDDEPVVASGSGAG